MLALPAAGAVALRLSALATGGTVLLYATPALACMACQASPASCGQTYSAIDHACNGDGIDCTAGAPPNSAATCSLNASCNGTCGYRCSAGFCDQAGACPANNLPTSCGPSRGTCSVCPDPQNGFGTCVVATAPNYQCSFSCNAGYCINGGGCTANSASFCGGGTSACFSCPAPPANGVEVCTGGACGFTCNAGFCSNGTSCQANTAALCGTGATACFACTAAPAHGSPVCNASACDFVCNPGYYRRGAACVSKSGVIRY